MTIPTPLLRDVFGNEHARTLLIMLTKRGQVRYSAARDEMGLHPQEFQRALDRLEAYGLIGFRAPADVNKPHAKREYAVFVEATALGSFCADLWERMNADFVKLAREQKISEKALVAATGSE
ncbi:MAG: hypothetical protein ACT4PT_03340 [Methanobacteriota archaeon]